MASLVRETFAAGLGFPEAPRWHDGRLWVSDMARDLVLAIDTGGAVETICRVDGRPSGIGWMPDGSLLVVSMHRRCVVRVADGRCELHADVSGLVRADLNDMIVDEDGWAYVTNFGYDAATEEAAPTGIVVIAPNGEATMTPPDLLRPNGCAITATGRGFVVAETRVHRLSRYDIVGHVLSNHRVIGTLPSGTWADGMCLDAADHAWVADPKGGHCFRISPEGHITDVIDTAPFLTVACVLGGPDRRTLYLTLAEELRPFGGDNRALTSRIDAVQVDVPGAGVP